MMRCDASVSELSLRKRCLFNMSRIIHEVARAPNASFLGFNLFTAPIKQRQVVFFFFFGITLSFFFVATFVNRFTLQPY